MSGFGIDGVQYRSNEGLSIIRSGGSAIPRYMLTELGKLRAEDGSITGAQGEIIAALDGDVTGSMTKGEIVRQTRMEDSRVRMLLNKLKNAGYVQETKRG
jgi:hypothetical protein